MRYHFYFIDFLSYIKPTKNDHQESLLLLKKLNHMLKIIRRQLTQLWLILSLKKKLLVTQSKNY